MTETTRLECSCGAVQLHLAGRPIISVECCCTTCQLASQKFEALPGAPRLLTEFGSTPYVLYRKDRVQFSTGKEQLAAHRLGSDARSRRVIATCCNTPVFLEFDGGHWLSLYGPLWPAGTRPELQARTMTRSLPDRSLLPNDVPNPKRHTARFNLGLFRAWAAMGFRAPTIEIPRTIDA